MAYSPQTDFLALLRQTSGGARVTSLPGLDFVTAALARAGLFSLWVNPTTPPSTNVQTTVWLKVSSTDWATEGSVFLWNPQTVRFELATPTLWRAVFAASTSSAFQSVAANSAIVASVTTLLAVQRNNPGITTLTLPTVVGRLPSLQIVDWSTNIAAHQIAINPAPGETIMQAATFSVYSTPDQFGGVTLYPSVDLNGWVIAP